MFPTHVGRKNGLPLLAGSAALVLTIGGATVLAAGAESPTQLQMFLGRLHPLIVHLPIGFILLAVLIEAASWTRPLRRLRHAMPFVLVVAAASAVVAVLAGYLLGTAGGYTGSTVLWHQRLGIAVAVSAVVAAGLRYALRLTPSPTLWRAYLVSLVTSVGLLTVTAHLGGSLTHGPEYLQEYMPAPLRTALELLPREEQSTPLFARVEDAGVYEHLVAPALQLRCVSCHGPDKQNGDLRLDSEEGILKGGESGPVMVAGRASESELIRRIWLPEGHEDAMPPRGRKPLSVLEAELIRWWIDQGASFEQNVGEVAIPPSVHARLEQIAGPSEERVAPVLRTVVAAADVAAVEQARTLGLSLAPIAGAGHFLEVDCVTAQGSCGAEQIQALVPLSQQIAFLDLAGAPVRDEDLEIIGRFPHLVRLHLERTKVTDAGLAHLGGLGNLEYLNLHGTAVTDGGMQHLLPLRSLRSLYVWQTVVTRAGVGSLGDRIRGLKVSHGLDEAAMDSLRRQALQDSPASGVEAAR